MGQICGSDLDYSMGQWVIWVSDDDPVATLIHTMIINMIIKSSLHITSLFELIPQFSPTNYL